MIYVLAIISILAGAAFLYYGIKYYASALALSILIPGIVLILKFSGDSFPTTPIIIIVSISIIVFLFSKPLTYLVAWMLVTGSLGYMGFQIGLDISTFWAFLFTALGIVVVFVTRRVIKGIIMGVGGGLSIYLGMLIILPKLPDLLYMVLGLIFIGGGLAFELLFIIPALKSNDTLPALHDMSKEIKWTSFNLSNYKNVDKVLLVLASVGIISVFLPWINVSVSVSSQGFGFSYKGSTESESILGVATWGGVAVLFILIGAIVVELKHLKPAILKIILPAIGLIQLIFFAITYSAPDYSVGATFGGIKSSSSVNFQFQTGYYVQLVILVGMLLYTVYEKLILFKAQTPALQLRLISNDKYIDSGRTESNESTTASNPISGETKEISISYDVEAPNSELVQTPKKKSGLAIPAIIFAILIIVGGSIYLYLHFEEQASIKNELAIVEEKSRIEKIIKQVNLKIGQKNYDDAYSLTNDLVWQFEVANNSSLVDEYQRKKENYQKQIVELKAEAKRILEEGVDVEPYGMYAIVEKAYFYKKPNLSAITRAYIIESQTVTVLKELEKFVFVSFVYNDKETSGWMWRGDLEPID